MPGVKGELGRVLEGDEEVRVRWFTTEDAEKKRGRQGGQEFESRKWEIRKSEERIQECEEKKKDKAEKSVRDKAFTQEGEYE